MLLLVPIAFFLNGIIIKANYYHLSNVSVYCVSNQCKLFESSQVIFFGISLKKNFGNIRITITNFLKY